MATCAKILKHVLHGSGKLVVKELNHISTDNWGRHMNTCACCKHPYLQPRFKEVLDKAVKSENREEVSEESGRALIPLRPAPVVFTVSMFAF